MPTISGIVRDDLDNPVAGRIVRAYRRDTGAMLAETLTGDGSTLVDPDYANVSLLLHMDGANGSTVFTDVSPSPKTVTAVGNAQISTAQSKFGGASGYFDGNGDYLLLPDSTAWDFTSSFTIEFWLYVIAFDTSGALFVSQKSGSGTGGFEFFCTQTGQLYLNRSNVSIAAGPSAGVLTTGAWHHLAATWDGSTYRIFFNGTSVASTSSTSPLANVSGDLVIGTYTNSTVYDLNGYIDDLRITKGVARYTANFTPPDAPFYPRTPDDPDYASVSLLLPMDGTNGSTTFVDRSPTPKTVTAVGNAQISTAQSQFGGASGYFDGDGDWLTVPHSSDFDFGSGNFTVELWAYQTAYQGFYNTLIARWGSPNIWILYVSGGAVSFLPSANGTGNDGFGMGVGGFTLNTWHHIAVVRSGSQITVYRDGIGGTPGSFPGSLFTASSALVIGTNLGGPTGRSAQGYIDDVRITKGVARYTANFTPPTRSGFSAPGLPVGAYEITTAHTGECNVVCLDDAAGTVYNDLILRTTPV
jgi:hypothetical protein